MSKSEAIRSILFHRSLTLRQIRPKLERKLKQIISRSDLYQLLATMQASGEVQSAGKGDWRFYTLKGK